PNCFGKYAATGEMRQKRVFAGGKEAAAFDPRRFSSNEHPTSVGIGLLKTSFRTVADVESELFCRRTMVLPALDANCAGARVHRGDKPGAAVQDWRGSPALGSVRDRHLHSGSSLTAQTAACSPALQQCNPMVRGGRGHLADRDAVSGALDYATLASNRAGENEKRRKAERHLSQAVLGVFVCRAAFAHLTQQMRRRQGMRAPHSGAPDQPIDR